MLLRFQKASLAHQVADVLHREIEAGTCRGWLPTERALCEQLSVSRRTLRAALQQLKQQGLLSAHVGVGTKVLASPAGRKFVPAADSVGLLMPEPIDVLRPYVTLWIDLLKTDLFESGVSLRVHSGRQFFRRRSGAALRRLVAQHDHPCWILALSNSWVQEWFRDNGINTIVAGMPDPAFDFPSVSLDSSALARHLAGRMLALGHERLVMLSEPRPSPGAAAAEEGFLQTVQAARNVAAHGEVQRPEPSPRGYRRAVEHLLQRRPRVTAIFVLNPLFGATVVTALMDHGLRLPDDMSFATTYGDPFMRFLSPEPTRYTYQPAMFARKLGRLALQFLHGDQPTMRGTRIVPTFIPGETLGRAPPMGRGESTTRIPIH